MSIDRGRARRDAARAPCYTAAPAVTPWLRLLLAAAAIVAASCQSARDTAPPVRADIRLGPDGTTTEAVVPPNATLESLFRQERMPAELSASILQAVRGVFNPRHLRADQVYRITRTVDGLFREFRYEIDADNVLRVAVRRPGVPDPAIDVAVLPLPKEYEASAAVAEITRDQNSLIGAFEAAGENVHLPLQVAEIFGGEVDFNADLQLGDRVEVLFERATREGEFIGYGDVEAAVLHIGTRRLLAFRFEGADGKVDWYDAQGRSLKRQFLRSPFSFNPRVTSGFSYNRFHPVHGTRRPHLGVDYGAPYGTQVKAVAAGVVEFAGWSGEAGRMVRIRHTGGYKTAYLHLSSFGPGIRVGARVNQGATVGGVGQSGTATGPHLDYRILKNGVYVNPIAELRRMPTAGEPLRADQLPEFARRRDEMLRELSERVPAGQAAVELARVSRAAP
jgi:murein DD-endopeptidase MepM/ murein hydrolase activator NlpD